MSGQRSEAAARVTTHSTIRQVSIVSVGKLRVSVADRAHLIP
ncbi:hypothetical protein ACFV24_29805 [Nocardia fluminea]